MKLNFTLNDDDSALALLMDMCLRFVPANKWRYADSSEQFVIEDPMLNLEVHHHFLLRCLRSRA